MARVEVVGWDAVKAHLLGRGGPVWNQAVQFSDDLHAEIVRNLSGRLVRVRTSRLRNSIEHRITTSGRRISISTGTNVKYARIVHDGRGPVEARNARALRFTLPNGTVVFAKRVGPAAPRPFIDAAVTAVSARYGVRLSRS